MSITARRCPECEIDWPNLAGFSACPLCKVSTRLFAVKPISEEEVRSKLNARDFERFYREWDSRRTGPSPEELDPIKFPNAQESVREYLELERIWRLPAA